MRVCTLRSSNREVAESGSQRRSLVLQSLLKTTMQYCLQAQRSKQALLKGQYMLTKWPYSRRDGKLARVKQDLLKVTQTFSRRAGMETEGSCPLGWSVSGVKMSEPSTPNICSEGSIYLGLWAFKLGRVSTEIAGRELTRRGGHTG